VDNISTLFTQCFMFSYQAFLQYLDNKSGQSVLNSLLKKTKIEISDNDNYLIICPNNGIRIFLESKKSTVEEYISDFLKKPVKIIFSTQEVKNKRRE